MRKPMPQQSEALRFLGAHDGQAGLFMACGTGKTLVAIRYGKRHLPALVLCRQDDFMTWRQELEEERVNPHHIRFIQSSKDSPFSDLGRWNIITYDLAKKYTKKIRSIPFQVAVADESHMIKRWKARRTKAIIRCTRHIPSRIPMTGTPITNDPEDVFSQCLFADNGKAFGNNYWSFRNHYYIQSGPGWYLKHNAKQKIISRLRGMAYYVHEDDVLKLPPIRRLIKSVPMSGQQRRQNDKILNDWEIQLAGRETIEIDQVITQLTKLRQVASGFIYDENHEAVWLKCYKLKLLISLLKDPDYLANKKKIVIWCAHTAEICMLVAVAATLKIGAVAFRGGSRKRKDEARRRFRDDKTIKLFIGQVDSGVGMNELVVSDTAVYYSNSFKVVSRQQSMRRIRRKGSEIHKTITYWDLVTEGTVYERILKDLRNNISTADYILSRIREGHPISTILTTRF